MKVIKNIFIALVIIVVLLVVVSFFLPSTVHVERSLVMKASVENIFDQVNTIKNWEKWSPWKEKDTAQVFKYEGPESGAGAKFSWESQNREVGTGSLLIVSSVPNDSIILELSMMDDENKAASKYTFEKGDSGIKVTWSMTSHLGWNPIGKYFGLMMDKMLGPDFENGLAKIRTLAESMPAPDNDPFKIGENIFPGRFIITIRDTACNSTIGQKLGQHYGEIQAYMKKCGLTQAGPAFSITYAYNDTTFDFDAGIQVDKLGKTSGKIKASEIKEFKAVKASYYGPYEGTGKAHFAIDQWVKANNMKTTGAPWELYITDPGKEIDPAKWLTEIYYPVE